MDGESHESSNKPTTAISADCPGGKYRLNYSALDTLMDSTDDSVGNNSTGSRATIIDTNPNYLTSLNDKKTLKKDESLLNDGSYFSELIEENSNLLDCNNNNGRSSKRRNNDTITDFQNYQSHHVRRRRRSSEDSSASSTPDALSLLTERLNRMTVKKRQNATYDLHGIPHDDEHYDIALGDRANAIERDPHKLKKLLVELDQMVEERLQFSKTSYAEGENFGEPDFPLLTPEQHHDPKKTLIAIDKIARNNSTQDVDDSQIPAAIQQRVQFLKHELDDKEFGEGLRLARQQNPEYVYAQRVKFLRADRYDVNLASARMIRFFDTKRELFCSPDYNRNNNDDCSGCLGRDLRLSDFSIEDLDLWKESGFIQLCGMRDRANRPIVVFFGMTITKAKISSMVVMRAYLYICNLLSRDDSTQRSGAVVLGYNLFTDISSSRKGEEVVKQYLKQSYPLLTKIIKVGMSAHLRSTSMHFCIDHPILNEQFQKIAGYMSTTTAARFRCHYINTESRDSFILCGSGSSKDKSTSNSTSEDSATSDLNNNASNSNLDAALDGVRANPSQTENDNDPSLDSDFIPHKEILYRLMTFGIPGETIPINDDTGEIQLEFHQAILKAIEEREELDRLLKASSLSSSLAASTTSSAPAAAANIADLGKELNGDKCLMSLTSSTSSDKLWMSLTASTASNTSFALFPNLFEAGELREESDHSAPSLFGSPPATQPKAPPKTENPLSDSSSSSFSTPLGSSLIDHDLSPSKPISTTSEIPQRTEALPSNPSAPNIVPGPNDVIMGRGPWNRTHPGNLRLKAMLERERDQYERVNRFHRMRIVDAMLNELYHDCGARFLYKPNPKAAQTHKTIGSNSMPHQTPMFIPCDMWLEAKREKAHDKITHDFRNLRRQKNVPPKSKQVVHNHAFSGYDN